MSHALDIEKAKTKQKNHEGTGQAHPALSSWTKHLKIWSHLHEDLRSQNLEQQREQM